MEHFGGTQTLNYELMRPRRQNGRNPGHKLDSPSFPKHAITVLELLIKEDKEQTPLCVQMGQCGVLFCRFICFKYEYSTVELLVFGGWRKHMIVVCKWDAWWVCVPSSDEPSAKKPEARLRCWAMCGEICIFPLCAETNAIIIIIIIIAGSTFVVKTQRWSRWKPVWYAIWQE